MKALKIIGIIVVVLIILVIGFAIAKDIKPVGMHSEMRLTDGIAIQGFDATSYFTSKPAKGNSDFSTEWNNAIWQFASAENLATFKANPEKFAPQYGGHCAFAIGKGFAAPAEAEIFSIHNNKIYLFSNTDVKVDFDASLDNRISTSDSNWKK